jgi:hypothetical protein
LTNTASQFYQFHLQGSRLYVVDGARTLVPTNEYSNLSVSGGNVTFNVPDWEQFYKQHNALLVTATSGGNTVTLQDDWWRLDSNAQNANVEITNDAAVRSALGIGASDTYDIEWVEKLEGYELINSADLLRETRRHEYTGRVHSHRANFLAMMYALDPQRKLEEMVSTPQNTVNFSNEVSRRRTEILRPNHEIVDETQSRTQERFVARGGSNEMYGCNYDESGNSLGSVWNISADREMAN